MGSCQEKGGWTYSLTKAMRHSAGYRGFRLSRQSQRRVKPCWYREYTCCPELMGFPVMSDFDLS